MTYPPEPRDNLIWYGIDFDGTIAHSMWSTEEPNALPGEPIWSNVAKLAEVRAAGFKVIIHSSRSWADYELIESYLNHHGIPFDGIQLGKPLYHRYCDDRAIHADRASWLDHG